MSNTNESLNRLMEQYKDIASEYYRLSTRDILSETEAKKLGHILEAASNNEELSLLLNEIDESIFQEDDSFTLENLSNYQNERSRALELTGENILPRQTIFENSKLNLETYKNSVEEYHRLVNLKYISELDERRMEKILEQFHQDELSLFLANIIEYITFEAESIGQGEFQECLQQIEKARRKIDAIQCGQESEESFEKTEQPVASLIAKTTERNSKQKRWNFSSRIIAACILTVLTIPCIRSLDTKPTPSTAINPHENSVEELHDNLEELDASLKDAQEKLDNVRDTIVEHYQSPTINETPNFDRAFESDMEHRFNIDSFIHTEEKVEIEDYLPQISPSPIWEWEDGAHEPLITPPISTSNDEIPRLNHQLPLNEVESQTNEEMLRRDHPQSPLEQNEGQSEKEETAPLLNDEILHSITASNRENETQGLGDLIIAPSDRIHGKSNSGQEEKIEFNSEQITYPNQQIDIDTDLEPSLDENEERNHLANFRRNSNSIQPVQTPWNSNGIIDFSNEENENGTLVAYAIQIQSGGGSNIFHSYEQLGLSHAEIAAFIASPEMRNILTRVDAPSVINGLIQVTEGNEAQLLHLATHGVVPTHPNTVGDRPTNGDTIRIGGGDQGQEPVFNASQTLRDYQSSISADSLENSDSGRVIVGDISAMGGNTVTDGGFVEVSSKQHLAFEDTVDVSAVNGGELLLDPEHISIINAYEINRYQTSDNAENITLNARNGGDVSIDPDQDVQIITTGNIQTRSPNANNGGNVTLNPQTIITTGNIQTRSNNGNAEDVSSGPDLDVKVGFIDARGGNEGGGGNIDIVTGRFFHATDTFSENAIISTRDGQINAETGTGYVLVGENFQSNARTNSLILTGNEINYNIDPPNTDQLTLQQNNLNQSTQTLENRNNIGTEQLRNLTGRGDELAAGHHRTITERSNTAGLTDRLPGNAVHGTVQLRTAIDHTEVTLSPFDRIGIQGETERYEISFRQPLIRTHSEQFALSWGFRHQDGQTFVFDDEPTPFQQGPNEDGVIRTSVFTFGQDYLSRDGKRAWSASSQFNLGTGLFDATTNDEPVPDAHIFNWQAQAQRVQQLHPSSLLIVRSDIQVSPDALLASEQFSMGGGQTVRGYSQNARTGDNEIRLSVEDRVTLGLLPSGTSDIQLVPFFDIGAVWNAESNSNEVSIPSVLAGMDVDFQWKWFLVPEDWRIQVKYGLPLMLLDNENNNTHEDGVLFHILYDLNEE